MPARDEAVRDIGICLREPFRDRSVFALEHQHSAVRRVGERSRNHDFTPFLRLPRELQMLRAKLRPPFERVGGDFVEEEEVLHWDIGLIWRRTRPVRWPKYG